MPYLCVSKDVRFLKHCNQRIYTTDYKQIKFQKRYSLYLLPYFLRLLDLFLRDK